MPMGEFTKEASEEALEKLREMFNAIPIDQRKDFIHQFSIVGTFIQASQRALQPILSSNTQPLCGDT